MEFMKLLELQKILVEDQLSKMVCLHDEVFVTSDYISLFKSAQVGFQIDAFY